MGWRQPSAQSPSEIKLYFSAPVQFCSMYYQTWRHLVKKLCWYLKMCYNLKTTKHLLVSSPNFYFYFCGDGHLPVQQLLDRGRVSRFGYLLLILNM